MVKPVFASRRMAQNEQGIASDMDIQIRPILPRFGAGVPGVDLPGHSVDPAVAHIIFPDRG